MELSSRQSISKNIIKRRFCDKMSIHFVTGPVFLQHGVLRNDIKLSGVCEMGP